MHEPHIDPVNQLVAIGRSCTHSACNVVFVLLALVGLSGCADPPKVATERASVSNSLDMPMVRIPAGEFLMGSDKSIPSLQKDFPLMERKCLEYLYDEASVHRVRISRAFYMGPTEVTVGQFR